MYAMKFNEAGFEICSAGSGTDAFDKLSDGFIPDIILLDIVMPGMDGFELLKNIILHLEPSVLQFTASMQTILPEKIYHFIIIAPFMPEFLI